MKNYLLNTINLFILLALVSCSSGAQKQEAEGTDISKIDQQLTLLLETSREAGRIPRTIHEGKLKFTGESFDWTEGFFPGTCWYMFELTNDEKWKTAAMEFQEKFVEHRFRTTNHDLGFVFNCSFGHGYTLSKDDKSRDVLIDAANSLITRFDPTVGCIKSWDVDKGWQSQRGWQYPVIIDNMMNLEMLFEVSKMTGDDKYKEIAITHAETTLKNHFIEDNSSVHVVDYDTITGDVRNKHTAQGFAHESAWARGQAWGLYGYTVCYRYTKDPRYLEQAEHIANFILSNATLPEDKVPYWDFNAPKIPNEPRDASAAAIIASALIELNGFSEQDFMSPAKEIVASLASEAYTAPIGSNHNFILLHSVGSIPHGAEIDVPLNYADYYYIEALYRLGNK